MFYQFNNDEIIPFSKLKKEIRFETLADRLEWDGVKPNQEIRSSAFGTMRFVKIDRESKKIIMIDQDNTIREFDLDGKISKYGNCVISYNTSTVYETATPPPKAQSCYVEDFNANKSDFIKYACALLNLLANECRNINRFYRGYLKRDPQWDKGKRIYTINLELEPFENYNYIASPKSIFIKHKTKTSFDLFQFSSLSALVYFWNLYTKEIIHFYRYYYLHQFVYITKYDEFTKLINQMHC